MNTKTVYAEDVNYWKTGQSSPDTWIDRAKGEIIATGGKVLSEAYGSEMLTGRSAFMLSFSFGDDVFKAVWPVLSSKTKNEKAARIQAATMLYHDIKNSCVKVKVFGARVAFFHYLMLPDGRNASQASNEDLAQMFPKMLTVQP
jgi:hypothetical protein